MLLNHIILATLWIVYCVLHSVLASQRFKTNMKRRMKNYKRYRLWYTLFAFITLAAILYYQFSISTTKLFALPKFISVVVMIMSFAGLILMFVCIQKYFMRVSGLHSLLVEDHSNKLEITGVNKYSRHPLYLGTFVFIWGVFLLFPYLSLLIANSVITLYTLIGIELEEHKLIAGFGNEYEEYRRNVPKLIPFLKPRRKH